MMELMPFFIIGASLLSVGVPLLGTIAIWASLYGISPYSRKVFFKNVGWASPDPTIRKLSFSLSPWVFAVAGMCCVTIAFLVELAFSLGLMALISNDDVSGFLMLVAAGSIEESSKFAVSLGLFASMEYFWASVRERDPVRDGILAGLFVGCSFGLVESVGYLVIGFSALISDGISFTTIDPIAWRIALGVLIHGMFASIAAVGLGRRGVRGVFAWSAAGLSIAIILHSLNNGIQGFFLLILHMDSLPVYLAIDMLQILLFVAGAAFLIRVWRSRKGVLLTDRMIDRGPILP